MGDSTSERYREVFGELNCNTEVGNIFEEEKECGLAVQSAVIQFLHKWSIFLNFAR